MRTVQQNQPKYTEPSLWQKVVDAFQTAQEAAAYGANQLFNPDYYPPGGYPHLPVWPRCNSFPPEPPPPPPPIDLQEPIEDLIPAAGHSVFVANAASGNVADINDTANTLQSSVTVNGGPYLGTVREFDPEYILP